MLTSTLTYKIMGLDAKLVLVKKGLCELSVNDIVKDFYFRKVNCLHGFVERKYDNVELNCNLTKISQEDIEELNNIVTEILKGRDTKFINENLPPTGGFFFGPTEIDEYYFECVEEVKSALNDIMPIINEVDVLYWCWW